MKLARPRTRPNLHCAEVSKDESFCPLPFGVLTCERIKVLPSNANETLSIILDRISMLGFEDVDVLGARVEFLLGKLKLLLGKVYFF